MWTKTCVTKCERSTIGSWNFEPYVRVSQRGSYRIEYFLFNIINLLWNHLPFQKKFTLWIRAWQTCYTTIVKNIKNVFPAQVQVQRTRQRMREKHRYGRHVEKSLSVRAQHRRTGLQHMQTFLQRCAVEQGDRIKRARV